jgi:hypothetical protein
MSKIGKWLSAQRKATADKTKKIVGYETTKKFAADTKEIAVTVLNPKKTIAQARNETFKEAKRRLKVTEEDLKANYKNFAWLCLMSLGFALFLLVIAISSIVHAQLFQALTCMSITAYCLANAFKFSFRAFQIKHQKLCGVKTWLHSKSDWLPYPFI